MTSAYYNAEVVYFMRRKHEHRRKLDNHIYNLCNSKNSNEVISAIIFLDGKCDTDLIEKITSMGIKIKYELELINAVAVEAPAEMINQISTDKSIAYISMDSEVSTCMDIARQAINANECEYTGEDICVAVVDTGIYPHPDLTVKKNRIIKFVDFVNKRTNPYDDNGHGTHVAGIIAGNGNKSNGLYQGVAPGVNVIGLKVMDYMGSGNMSNILAALDWVYKNKEKYNIRIVSMSLGASGINSKYDPLVMAVDRLWDSGIIVVAAAGNEGPLMNTISSPGSSSKIITVACSDDKGTPSIDDDTIADFSSRGPSFFTKYKPDLAAPGVDIMSLSTGGGYVTMSGTSMATPIVSGCCALLLQKSPELTPDKVKQKLLSSTNDLNDIYQVQGRGLIDVKKVLS